MKLAELSFELCRAQLARQSAAGVIPRIMSWCFIRSTMSGKMFSCRATFNFGSDFITQFTLDDAADLTDRDWEQRLDAAVFNNDCRWPQ